MRIPASLAKRVHFHPGTLVELTVQEGSILVKPIGKRKLTLDEKLASFDPKTHGEEVMASKGIGLEKF